MSKIRENIDTWTIDLLHIEDVDKNKLIDLEAGDLAKTYYITHELRENISKYVLDVISSRIGKPGNTVLRKSADTEGAEQVIGRDINDLDWRAANGQRDPAALRKYIEGVYKELALKGNNPLFLSVGAVSWKVAAKDDTVKEVKSPLVLFPIKLIRSGSKNTPVYVEFINDDIYLNPCFLAKLRQVAGDKIADEFPHPNGAGVDVDMPIDVGKLADGEHYFKLVDTYVSAQNRDDISSETAFTFDKNVVAIAQYNHDELCMYYDIKRNKEKIYTHPLINRIFTKSEPLPEVDVSSVRAQFIMPRDSVQERIIKRVVAGQSLVVKGPPGTGKTLTITNLIASLLVQNKRVLLSSQKSAAMFEVYAKLPEELRKFVMLLDSETEAQAAKLNVVDVKKDFNALLQQKKTYTPDTKKYEELDAGNLETSSAITTLSNYVNEIFNEKDVIGVSYYEALDILCKHDVDPVLFADPKDAARLTREGYSALMDAVEDASEWFAKISNGHSFAKSPWYPVDGDFGEIDFEKAVEANKAISTVVVELVNEAAAVFAPVCPDYKKLPLAVVEFLASGILTEKQIEEVMNPENAMAIDNVCVAYDAYLMEEAPAVEGIKPSDEATTKYVNALSNGKIDLSLKKSEFIAFYNQANVLSLIKEGNRMEALAKTISAIRKIHDDKKECLDAFYSVFRSDIGEKEFALVKESYAKLSAYEGKNAVTPKALDFKSKKYYAELKLLGYGDEISFADVVKGVCLYEKALGLDEAEKDAKIKMSQQFRVKLDEAQLLALFAFAEKCASAQQDPAQYLGAFEACKEDFYNAICAVQRDGDWTLKDLVKAYRVAASEIQVGSAVERYKRALGQEYVRANALTEARAIRYLSEIVNSKTLGVTAPAIAYVADAVYKNGFKLGELICRVSELLKNFGKAFFDTFYTRTLSRSTLGDMDIFIAEAGDRNVLSAVNEYIDVKVNSGEIFSLERFFRPFELGVRERGDVSFTDIFEHSIYYLAVKYRQAAMGAERNGLGEKVSREFDEWSKGSALIDKATLSIIESQCMARINPDDPDFAFLKAERASGETLRKLFKNNARAILKLKKCFILSPSTASVFFGKEEFSDFDIVIIDEASQLEPTAILPVLFRAKQVVLVGDEWQMPPIRHFTSRTEKRVTDEEGESKLMSPNMSVLGLALDNLAFPTEQFVCHYRSKTEALIAFSQERFYPNMRTFPANVPKAKGLGFKDVYIPTGCCDGGVNEEEAVAAVNELKALFDEYYDDETGVLSASVGVVAFGKAQKDRIEALVARDKDLNAKIKKALSNFNDVPEKLIFFKTIETVQGQETDHLILSITYGRSKTGKIVQSFGELNRGFDEDKLGQCIFNVAVTRAKSSVTVLHSVEGAEIKRSSVEFIGQYLETAKRFSEGGKAQWVGKSVQEATGFIRQVADYVVSCGIDENRVVVDCGATKGSVKIPVVILSEDLSEAKLAVWCEKPIGKEYDYLDYNVRYVDSLKARGWNIVRMFVHDWVDNNEAEKKLLKDAIEKFVK